MDGEGRDGEEEAERSREVMEEAPPPTENPDQEAVIEGLKSICNVLLHSEMGLVSVLRVVPLFTFWLVWDGAHVSHMWVGGRWWQQICSWWRAWQRGWSSVVIPPGTMRSVHIQTVKGHIVVQAFLCSHLILEPAPSLHRLTVCGGDSSLHPSILGSRICLTKVQIHSHFLIFRKVKCVPTLCRCASLTCASPSCWRLSGWTSGHSWPRNFMASVCSVTDHQCQVYEPVTVVESAVSPPKTHKSTTCNI